MGGEICGAKLWAGPCDSLKKQNPSQDKYSASHPSNRLPILSLQIRNCSGTNLYSAYNGWREPMDKARGTHRSLFLTP